MTKVYINCPKHNRPIFEINYDETDTDYALKVSVKEILSYNVDGTPADPVNQDDEVYLTATIKWDGCTHFNFGDEDGYLHLCGKYHYDNHSILMKELFSLAGKLISKWDSDVAGENK